jgi:ubiquitin C-terminal hydrolase
MKLSCKHFSSFAQKNKNQFTKLNQKLEEKSSTCSQCMKIGTSICLHCEEIHCTPEHSNEHFLKQNKHPLIYDLLKKEFFCHACSDFIIFENQSMKKLYLTDSKELKGIRGLYNLGNTCFMNSVLQTFVHNPIFKDYLLNCDLQEENDLNLGIEFKKIIKEMNNGSSKPYNPHRFLYSIWNHGGFFFGYSQQDAHEFYMTILNFDEIQNFSNVLFQGKMQSDIVCTKCNTVSTTFDPFIDISLNMKSIKEECDLEENFVKFIKSENIGDSVFCKKCQGKFGSTKQVTIKSIPIIICFHMKVVFYNSLLEVQTKKRQIQRQK